MDFPFFLDCAGVVKRLQDHNNKAMEKPGFRVSHKVQNADWYNRILTKQGANGFKSFTWIPSHTSNPPVQACTPTSCQTRRLCFRRHRRHRHHRGFEGALTIARSPHALPSSRQPAAARLGAARRPVVCARLSLRQVTMWQAAMWTPLHRAHSSVECG